MKPRLDPDLPLAQIWERLRPVSSRRGELKIGKRGVYLITRGKKIATFQLVDWQVLLRNC